MKKLITITLFLLGYILVRAEVFTVSNSVNYTAQYTNLQSAIDDAASGDTILLSGSLTVHGDITVNKSLVIIGPGHYQQQGISLPATLSNVTISGISNNCHLEGLKIYRLLTTGTSQYTRIINCRITYSSACISLGDNDNWEIIGNVIDGYIDLNGTSDTCMISNNIFTRTSASLYDLNSSTLVFNNLFIKNGSGTSYFSNCNQSFVANNIFISTYSSSIQPNPNLGCSECSFVKNLTYQTYGFAFAELPGNGNFGSLNINNENPRFNVFSSLDQSFSYDHDYRLKDISVGKNAGTDGTDMGIYGSNFSYNIYGHGQLPRIERMEILNAVLPLDSILNINIEAVSGK